MSNHYVLHGSSIEVSLSEDPLPSPIVPLDDLQRGWVDATLSSLSLRERVGQMIMVSMLGNYCSVEDPDYAKAVRWVERDGIGGICMSLGTPVEVAAKLNDLQARARVPLLVSADLEPGLGRLEGGLFADYMMDAGSATVFPTAMALAATGRDSDAYEVGRAIAEEGRAVGIHVNLAPVVDVNNNPANPVIDTRSFGEDPQQVARLTASFVRGITDGGQFATAKHFPGHGDADRDSHLELPVAHADRARLESVELVPFRAAVAAGAALVMTSHVAFPAVSPNVGAPATLVPQIITGLLRDSLRFRGVTITDAMNMAAITKTYKTERSTVLAVKAGADILLNPIDVPDAIDAIVAAIDAGELSAALIDSAARRILELKVRSNVAFAPAVSLKRLREVVGAPARRGLAADVSQRAITLLRDSDNLVPILLAQQIAVVQYAPETEIKAGRAFHEELRRAPAFAALDSIIDAGRLSSSTTPYMLGHVERAIRDVETVVVTAFVRRAVGVRRAALAPTFASWVEDLGQHKKVVVIAFGSPYIIRHFPRIRSCLVTYGITDDLERAAARAISGMAPISGSIPVTLPGLFEAGDGIRR